MSFPQRVRQLFDRALAGSYTEREIQTWRRRIIRRVTGRDEVLLDDAGASQVLEFLSSGQVLERLFIGEPFEYVLGETEFYGLRLLVNPSVLIPRPETEELAAWVLDSYDNDLPLRVLDVGTGSGCLAVALAANRPAWQVWAADVSPSALDTARSNAVLNEVEVHFLSLDILHEVPESRFDVVVSNPPYIPRSETGLVAPASRRWEPDAALFTPDDDGMAFYRRLAALAPEMLAPGGSLFLELNEFRAEEAERLLREAGLETELRRDLQGKWRMARAFF